MGIPHQLQQREITPTTVMVWGFGVWVFFFSLVSGERCLIERWRRPCRCGCRTARPVLRGLGDGNSLKTGPSCTVRGPASRLPVPGCQDSEQGQGVPHAGLVGQVAKYVPEQVPSLLSSFSLANPKAPGTFVPLLPGMSGAGDEAQMWGCFRDQTQEQHQA